jgi:O-glycosyl hydrolase
MPGINDFFIRISVVLVILFACPALSVAQGAAQEQGAIDIRIDIHKTYQAISNFGASDAWSCQFAGNWPQRAKDSIADWLFSMDTLANGDPKGIGLSLWRFNIGAGSAQQGDSSGISDEWRRAGSFLEKNMRYNWRRQQGQLWFLQAARQRGVKQFLGFFNSPPVQLTGNGKAYTSNGRCNIDSSRYSAFAVYAADVVKGIKKNWGIGLDYISPVNEPQWDWSDGGQEGCPYSNREISAVVKAFNAALLKDRLATRIVVSESGHHKYLFADADKPGRGKQVEAFFDPSSSVYIGNLSHVSPVIASHSYFSVAPVATAMDIREKLARRVAAVKGLVYWQSEYCILGDNAGEINGAKRDLGMNAALHVARVIYSDIAIGNASAWQWWLALSPYDYKDGLIYIDKNKTGGHYYDSKLLWAFGNYSRFVRPGMVRVDAAVGAGDSVLVSAYKEEKKKKLVLVVINSGAEARLLMISGGTGNAISASGKWDVYTTSESTSLEKHTVPAGAVTISPRTVVTLETVYSDL